MKNLLIALLLSFLVPVAAYANSGWAVGIIVQQGAQVQMGISNERFLNEAACKENEARVVKEIGDELAKYDAKVMDHECLEAPDKVGEKV